MDELNKNYNSLIFLADFNVSTNDNAMSIFCSLNNLRDLIDKLTCYKNSDKPTRCGLIVESYGDDKTPYSCAKYIPSVIAQRQLTASKLLS